MKNKIALLCLAVFSAQASLIKINPELTFVPHHLGKLELFHEGNEFKVLKNNKTHVVENYLLEKPLRGIDSKQLSKILLYSKLHVSEFGNDEIQIKSMGQLKGGGPVTGAVVYWAVKSLGWGAVGLTCAAGVATVTAASVATAGAATGALAAGGAAFGTATTITAIGGTGLAAGGAAAITAVGGTATAVTGTIGASVGAAGGITAIATGIETAAIASSFAATMCPFLP
ncbi:MAG: hypothetical protein P4L31_06335 [Candidatus Babeliales bacterium]|nr:hypothetical protein [Candidatus Babeliales bacterium]